MSGRRSRCRSGRRRVVIAGFPLLLALVLDGTALAAPSPLHPTFPLLDEHGVNILDSRLPVSTMRTCGACHDTGFIASHSFHTTVGLDQFGEPGRLPGSRPWEMSLGLFGRWDPVSYRYLTPAGDEFLDLGTPDWIKTLGVRHVGGGPAERAPDGTPLVELKTKPGDAVATTHDPTTGESTAWDWRASGTIEMNCFLCHTRAPDNEARIGELEAGRFRWANTATLLGTHAVERRGDGWVPNRKAFRKNGDLKPGVVEIQGASPDNCGLCHGTVHESKDPLICADIDRTDWHTLRTGQIFSGQRLSDSGLNLHDKADLTHAWDVHSERNVDCTDCHFSINNPIYEEESADRRPDYLTFDPRHMSIGEYLYQPSHDFAKGATTQHLVAPKYAGTMRRCASCHDATTTHDWLPYKDAHMEALSCEACHVPRIHMPALEQIDWTVVDPDGQAPEIHRGIEGECGNPRDLIDGYVPALIPRENSDGHTELVPANLVAAWYWTHDEPERPVRQEDLRAVYLGDRGYRATILELFDDDRDGTLDHEELRLDDDSKVDFIRRELEKRGLRNVRIRGEVQPYGLHHNVVAGEWATRSCARCHGDNSRVSRPLRVGAYVPGGVAPLLTGTSGETGEIHAGQDGALYYRTSVEGARLYLPGHNRIKLIDVIGWLAILGTLLGIVVHSGYRLIAAARPTHRPGDFREVYLYTFYERAWHWMQAIVILLLIASGIVIHRPDQFGRADFGLMVPLHNTLAILLVLNAVFALFFHLASGEIRQYLPEPHGFFRKGLAQIDFYVRGVFKGEDHPFEKTPQHKLNPLQQVTYLGILNVLLPLQILSGLLMFGVGQWPGLAQYLPLLAPLHTLVAWFFVAFVLLHVYLTTTGPTVTADIKGMITGWDKVKAQEERIP